MQLRKIQTFKDPFQGKEDFFKNPKTVMVNIANVKKVVLNEECMYSPAHYEIFYAGDDRQDTDLTNEEGMRMLLASDTVAEELALEENFLNGHKVEK